MQHDDLLLAGNLNRNSCHNAFPRPQLLRTKLIPLKLSALALVVHVAVLVAVPPAAAQSPFTPRYSLFDPGTNAQTGALQGSCVAIDGNIAVTGSPEDATGGTLSGAARVYDATTGVLLYRLVNPRASDYDYFGRSVAISGRWVVVGADYEGAAGTAYVYDLSSATPAVPAITLDNPTFQNNEFFGHSVAISGTRLAVGSPYDNTGATESGSVYVYDLTSATPTAPVLTLTNPTPQVQDHFGISVAISETRVVVGATEQNPGRLGPGTVYVYDLSSSNPGLPAVTLNNPEPTMGGFGWSVAVSGARVVAGPMQPGCVYVYDLNRIAPTMPVARLCNPTPPANDWFGHSVAIFGTRVVVCDIMDSTIGGTAFVYDLASSSPTVAVARLSNPRSGDYYFGWSVAICGARVVVGSPYDSAVAGYAGSAYVYDLGGATPTSPIAALNSPSLSKDDHFGWSVAVSDRRLVVGTPSHSIYIYDLASRAPTQPVAVLNIFSSRLAMSGNRLVLGATDATYVYDVASAAPTNPVARLNVPGQVAISGSRIAVGNSGSVYIYDLDGTQPSVPIAILNNTNAGDFGSSLAISGTRVVVGAFTENTGAIRAGSAYVYDLASAAPTAPVATLHNPTPDVDDRFGWSVAISGTRVVVGAIHDTTGGFRAGSAYVYNLGGARPTVPIVTLNNPTPSNWYFGWSVAISGTRVVVGQTFNDLPEAHDPGKVYVYDVASATPSSVPVATLKNPTLWRHDGFGTSVAIDGATIVVGSPYDDTTAEDRGAVYVFGRIPPRLQIACKDPEWATISWMPADSTEFVLQFNDPLAPDTWVNAPSGASNPVTISSTNAARFYRLWSP